VSEESSETVHTETDPAETSPAADDTAPDTTTTSDTTAASDTATTSDTAATPDTGAGPGAAAVPGVRRMPRKLVFRVPGSAYIGVVFLIMCASFVAAASPWFILVYLLPLAVAVWLSRTRTEVDAERLVIRRVLTRTVLPWSAVASLHLADRHWIRAVRTDGREITLPTVRTRHLPALAVISGGRVTDPTGSGTGVGH
jgi:hypothetical protein